MRRIGLQQLAQKARHLGRITPHNVVQTRLIFPTGRRAAQHILSWPIGNIFVQARFALALREKKLTVGLRKKVRCAIHEQDFARLQLFAALAGPCRRSSGQNPPLWILEILDFHQRFLVIGNGPGFISGGGSEVRTRHGNSLELIAIENVPAPRTSQVRNHGLFDHFIVALTVRHGSGILAKLRDFGSSEQYA